MNRKRVLLLITVITLFFSLFSCSDNNGEPTVANREYDKATVEEAAKVLIEKSIPLNEILYGKGLLWDESEEIGIYKKASQESLELYGLNTVTELKQKISEVFSLKYIESLDNSDVFGSVKDGENIKFYTRYFDETEEGKTYIFVNTNYDYPLKNKYEYISEPCAVRSEGELVIVNATVKASIIGESGDIIKSREFEHQIKMIEENGKWRLNSATYIVYNEYTDIYENMNK